MTSAISTPCNFATWLGPTQAEPGIDPDSFARIVSDDEYHADREFVSSTRLKTILKTPQHFKAALEGEKKDTRDREFGRLTHLAVFEPDRFESEVIAYPGELNRAKRACKAFIAAHPNQTVLSSDKHRDILAMRDAVRAHRFRGRTLGEWFDEGQSEKAIYFTERSTGIKCRVKADNLHPEVIFDLKSTTDAAPAAFLRSALAYHYDLSAFMYQTGVSYFTGDERPFVLIAVEKEAPYSVMTYVAGDSLLDNGALKFEDGLSRLKAARENNRWPGYAGEYVLEVDPWREYRSNHDILGD